MLLVNTAISSVVPKRAMFDQYILKQKNVLLRVKLN